MSRRGLDFNIFIGMIFCFLMIIGITSAACSNGVCSSDPGGYMSWTKAPSSTKVSSTSCLVPCSTCASGYCNDCNHDKICDSPGGSSPGGSTSCSKPCSTCASGYCDDCNGDLICDSPGGYSPGGYSPGGSTSCRKDCPNCPSGYCDDCNDDGVCDSSYGTYSQPTMGSSIIIINPVPSYDSYVPPPTPSPTPNKYKVITKVVTKSVKEPTNLAVVVKTARPLNSAPDKVISSATTNKGSSNTGINAVQTSGTIAEPTSTGVTGPVNPGTSNPGLTGGSQWSNENSNPVLNGPSKPTTITLPGCVKLVSIKTVHWNGGKGQTPGTISLRHQDGTVYGPWNARGEADRTGAQNVNWVAEPLVTIKAGTYTVVDSDPKTWSYNSGSQGSGIAIASYDQVTCPAGMGTPVPAVAPVVKPTVAQGQGQSLIISSSLGNSFSNSGSSFSFGSGGSSFSSGGISIM